MTAQTRFAILALLTLSWVADVSHAGPEAAPKTDRYGQTLPAGVVARLGVQDTPYLDLPDRSGGAIAFSANGKMLAFGQSDNTVRLWDVTSGRELHHFLPFHPSADPEDVKWALPGTKSVYAIKGPNHFFMTSDGLHSFRREARPIVFSPDGKLLIAAESDRTIRIWHLETGKSDKTLHVKGHVRALSADGRYLALHREAYVDKLKGQIGVQIEVWDVERDERASTETISFQDSMCPSQMVFAPASRTLAVGRRRFATPCPIPREWGKETGAEYTNKSGAWIKRNPKRVDAIAFSPDGTLAAEAIDGMIWVWDTKAWMLR